MSDKPNGERLGWTVLETSHLYADTRFSVRRDRLRLPNGDEVTYTYPVKKGAVFIVPITKTFVFQQEPLLRAIHARATAGQPFDAIPTEWLHA